MLDFVTDKRFLVGLAVGWLVIPWAARAISMRMSAGVSAGTQAA
jgi:hypothetical protein